MARKRLSTVQRAYNKERRRIERAIDRLSKRGYLTGGILPPEPKRVTKASVNRLKKIDTNKIVEKSRYVDQSTGEILSGKAGQNLERKLRAQRAAETRRSRKLAKSYQDTTSYVIEPEQPARFDTQVLFNFQNSMSEIFAHNPPLLLMIKQWYDESVKRFGVEDLAEALESAYEAGEWPGFEDVSDERNVNIKLLNVTRRIGVSEGMFQDFVDALEFEEDWDIEE